MITSNFIMLQKDDLKEVVLEILKELGIASPVMAQATEADAEYLPRNEVCARLHITPTTLWRMGKRGEIKVHKIGSRNLYVKSEVDELVSNGPSADIEEKKGGVA